MTQREYKIVFISNIPSFYKVKLWNRINSICPVFALFVNSDCKTRTPDFLSELPEFDYQVLPKNFFKKVGITIRLLHNLRFDRLIIGGWESPVSFLASILSSKEKNAIICESSIYEYKASPVKNLVKKWILNRVTIGFPAGIAQGQLLKELGFRGKLVYSGGCGILNYVPQPEFSKRNDVTEFLYVGRLEKEKNLDLLINAFADFPKLHLSIIGYGREEQSLRSKATKNITFLGEIKNKGLSDYYRKADVFILPSETEPWGLVVEEALNNGTPVIVSDHVGCKDDLVSVDTGLVFEHNSIASLKHAITRICDVEYYNRLRLGVSKLDFETRTQNQINAFLDNPYA